VWRGPFCLATNFFYKLEQSLHADGPANRRTGSAAKQRDKPVVTASAAHGRLRPEAIGCPLEHGVAVVVEPTHQARVQREGQARVVECGLQSLEMGCRLRAEKAVQLRRAFDHGLHIGVLAVQNPQGVRCQPPQTVFVQHGLVFIEIGDEALAKCQPFFERAETVEFQ